MKCHDTYILYGRLFVACCVLMIVKSELSEPFGLDTDAVKIADEKWNETILIILNIRNGMIILQIITEKGMMMP